MATVLHMAQVSEASTDAPGEGVAPMVGERIHAEMWRRRVTQRELGARIGVSQSTLSKKLRGQVPVTVTELVAISEVLGVEAADLLPQR